MKIKANRDIYIGIGFLLFCAFFFILSMDLPPGAATFPILLLAILSLLACLIFWDGYKKTRSVSEDNNEEKAFCFSDLKMPFVTFIIISGYFALFALTGYFIATIIFMIVLMRYFKEKSWRKILMISAGFILIIYAMFVKQLNVPVLNFGYLEQVFYMLRV